MATNDLTITQISTILNEIVGQATGSKVLAAVDGSQFVTVAQMGLKAGYDPLVNAIGQVLTRTIFSQRKYRRKLKDLNVSTQKFGNITRKLQIADSDWEDDQRLPLTDNESIDMFKVKKPNVLQTNFYGANTYQRHYTLFRDQLDTAFSNAAEFAAFVYMYISNVDDQIEQCHETVARAILVNYMAGKIDGDADNVIHLLTEYNAQTGLSLTAEDVYKPENFSTIMRFASARIKSLRELMTERSLKFHTNITGKEIMRHTPLSMQKAYLYAPTKYNIESTVLSELFNDKYVQLSGELVNFWQSIDTPDQINFKPIYLNSTDGSLKTASAAVEKSNVLGVIFDEEALGYTIVNTWSATTPFNAAGGYWNTFFHFTDRYWNDFTENGIVLLLD